MAAEAADSDGHGRTGSAPGAGQGLSACWVVAARLDAVAAAAVRSADMLAGSAGDPGWRGPASAAASRAVAGRASSLRSWARDARALSDEVRRLGRGIDLAHAHRQHLEGSVLNLLGQLAEVPGDTLRLAHQAARLRSAVGSLELTDLTLLHTRLRSAPAEAATAAEHALRSLLP